MSDFIRERDAVARLAQWLDLAVKEHRNPREDYGKEIGLDVVTILEDGRRIGSQVTELDTGIVPGAARADEKSRARNAAQGGLGTYGTWGQNNPDNVIAAVSAAVKRKVAIANRNDLSMVDEAWLLIWCGVPEMGAIASTMVMTPWLHPSLLNRKTADILAASKYHRAYLLPTLGMEKCLYYWTLENQWVKETHDEPVWMQGPSFWEVMSPGSDWLTDPEGTYDRLIERCAREFGWKLK